jgi:heat shock protein HtpX
MKNFAKTAVLLAALGGLFIVLGGLLGGQTGLWIGLILGLVIVGGSYWFSDRVAIASARAVEVTPQQAPEYHQIIDELVVRAGIPKPRLYIAASDQPNAFATGRSPRHAAVCVNQGLLQLMSWDEVRGVLAHELMHVRNRDILTSSIAAAIGMAITFVASMARFTAIFGGGGHDDDRPNPIALIAMSILAPLAAMVIQMGISRSREYAADASAAKLLGTGEPLARALEHLDSYSGRIPANVNPNQASAYIVNPLKGRKVQFGNLFSTHPPVADRVARLRSGNWA